LRFVIYEYKKLRYAFAALYHISCKFSHHLDNIYRRYILYYIRFSSPSDQCSSVICFIALIRGP